ncbi:SRPBCC family protein [Dactylosporangium sp. NPDC050688]|uniref:SRPBCC family protein n=1 Tax=Dactylosporangium sp. NPDC050688 TaxID=3157217 RepID=UPI0033D4AD2B
MTVTGSYGFTAPPEVVFGTLTDPDRVARWLPSGVTADRAGPDRYRIRAGGTVVVCEVATVPDDLRLEWRLADRPGVHGTFRAEDGPAGGAQVHISVDTPDAGPDRVLALVGDAMRRLQLDVSDNFNAG